MNTLLNFARLSSMLAFTGMAISAQAHCYTEAAHLANLHPLLVQAVAKTESEFNANAINVNTNGSIDIGTMQINSSHLGWLKRYGVTAEGLRKDACLNIKVGTLILAQNIAKYGQNWDAIGAYNVGCRKLSHDECYRRRSAYAWKVYKNYQQLLAQRG